MCVGVWGGGAPKKVGHNNNNNSNNNNIIRKTIFETKWLIKKIKLNINFLKDIIQYDYLRSSLKHYWSLKIK